METHPITLAMIQPPSAPARDAAAQQQQQQSQQPATSQPSTSQPAASQGHSDTTRTSYGWPVTR